MENIYTVGLDLEIVVRGMRDESALEKAADELNDLKITPEMLQVRRVEEPEPFQSTQSNSEAAD
jgi:hypothetical protein